MVPFLEQKGFAYEEFNRRPVAGRHAAGRLDEMIGRSAFALLVMTAEDLAADGALWPRANVIYEAGFAQGRLGFDRAVILAENGLELFSNVSGMMTIRFAANDIKSAFGELRPLLEQWAREAATPSATGNSQTLPVGRRRRSSWGVVVAGLMAVGGTWALHSVLDAVFLGMAAFLLCVPIGMSWGIALGKQRRRARVLIKELRNNGRIFTDRDLSRSALAHLDLSGSDLSRCRLQQAELKHCRLDGCRLYKVDLREAQLEHVSAIGANFMQADLGGVYLRMAILKKAVFRQASLLSAQAGYADLEQADLTRASLVGANLFHANLRAANLAEADLQGAVLADADLRDANLMYSDVRGADFSGADLRGANLQGADLNSCRIDGALLAEPKTEQTQESGAAE